jgi:hypothetical protein
MLGSKAPSNAKKIDLVQLFCKDLMAAKQTTQEKFGEIINNPLNLKPKPNSKRKETDNQNTGEHQDRKKFKKADDKADQTPRKLKEKKNPSPKSEDKNAIKKNAKDKERYDNTTQEDERKSKDKKKKTKKPIEVLSIDSDSDTQKMDFEAPEQKKKINTNNKNKQLWKKS